MVFYLVGYMGCGKSTVGRSVARRTGLRFVDTDKEVEQRCGMTIPEIFASRGEEYFRGQEREVLRSVTAEADDSEAGEQIGIGGVGGEGQELMSEEGRESELGNRGVIVATGGGVPCFGDNMDYMNATGKTIYLKMSADKLVARLKGGRHKRPIISNMNDTELLDFVRTTLAKREEFYRQASMTIDCDGVSDAYVSEHIEKFVEYCSGKEF